MRLLLVVALLCAPATLTAQISDITWSAPEIVDAIVTDVSSPSGVSVTDRFGDWHLVYEKNGDIFHRVRTSGGWQPATQLSNDPASSRNPHLALETTYLHVVWEDDRTGHTEVWSRTWDQNTGWLAEVCLTCDATESSQPVIDHEDGSYAYLAWTEAVGATTQVRGRLISNNSLWAIDDLSVSTGAAFEPTVALHPNLEAATILWSDTRDGTAEIFSRTVFFAGGMTGEFQITNLDADSRRPSAHSEHCCGINIHGTASVLFDSDVLGTREVFSVCVTEAGGGGEVLVSPDDGVPSMNPSVGGLDKPISVCIPEVINENAYVGAWTEVGPSRDHIFARLGCPGLGEHEPIRNVLGNVTVAGIEGSPTARLIRLWVELDNGTPTLMSQIGTQVGCSWPGYDGGPDALLLVPDGSIANVMTIVDTCSGDPIENVDFTLWFDAALANDLVWDVSADQPPLIETTNAAGEVSFVLQGGGCSQADDATLFCGFDTLELWPGAKSPDVDGDCEVEQEDRDYVVAALGGSDFCADLDGSGVVDAADVAIVDATMGAECTSVVSVGEASTSLRPQLIASPNPSGGPITFQLDARPTNAVVRIYDVAGRQVRTLRPSVDGALPWDLRDAAGRRVAPGTYFAVLEQSGNRLAHSRLQIIR